MRRFRPLRPWRWAIVATLLIAAGILIPAFRIPYSADTLRQRVIDTLADRLDAEVELTDLQIDVAPRMRVVGTGLAIRHRGRTDVPPLISVATFTVDADVLGLWNKHVAHVKLDGLEIQIPPGDDDDSEESRGGPHFSKDRQVVIDLLEASDAKLINLRRDPKKPPRTWIMHQLRVESVSANTSMPFEATLRNAVPPGTIHTTGAFGPWHRDDPGHTPVNGEFVLRDADLRVFKGISGVLSAHGLYTGSLDRIDVRGATDTPDFTVAVSGQPVPLKTKYHAIVDGTNGNTTLAEIDASFLNTSLAAKGGVYEVEGAKGREVKLDVTMDRARLEDVMRLAVKTRIPPMTGALRLQTKFHLPPGDKDVVEKLRLDGRFFIDSGRFTDAGVQHKINEMSLRATGKLKASQQPSDTGRQSSVKLQPVRTSASTAPQVVSDFQGRFRLRGGALALQTLVFDIPGAAVRLNGRYHMREETIDFRGNLLMDAKVSQTVTGWKSWLLKIADPFFRKDGQTVVPIKIAGTRHKPAFGIEFGRVF